MPVTTDIISNIKTIDKQLDDLIEKQIPFATSRAMQKTVIEALDEAEDEFEKYVAKGDEGSSSDRLTPNLAKKGPGKGAIRARWPSKADINRGFKNSKGETIEAAVYIVNSQRNGRFDLIDEIHPLVFGGTVKKVPGGSRIGVITPTTALLKGLEGKGRLKKLNEFGNFAKTPSGFKSLIKYAKKNKQLFLEVPINSGNPRFNHLPAGLYFKGREKSKGGTLKVGWRYKNGKLSRVKSTPNKLVQYRGAISKRGRAKRAQGRIVNYLVMLLAYHEERVYKPGFKFPQTVLASYDKNFGPNMDMCLAEAVADSRKKARNEFS